MYPEQDPLTHFKVLSSMKIDIKVTYSKTFFDVKKIEYNDSSGREKLLQT